MGCTMSTEQQVASTSAKKKETTTAQKEYPIYGPNTIMKRKAHGTSETPVQNTLRWGCDHNLADRTCNFNRHFAEPSGYFARKGEFLKELKQEKTLTFYDSNTGEPLFLAPHGRGVSEFLQESRAHGWPSFRDSEVNWDKVRCLRNGECVSLAGTHLGHNLPDKDGNRYCINLVSIAGRPTTGSTVEEETDNTNEAMKE